ncbi:hydrolase TatD [Clostridia bacterium]|nr:hydrolase TatD [Clostridia bacterium]
MIDTHVHLNDKRYENRADDIVAGFPAAGLSAAVNIAYDRPSAEHALAQAQKYAPVYCALGVHPHDSKEYTDADGDYFLLKSKDPKTVAIGEIGLDYHYDLSPRPAQREAFIKQLHIADKAGLPVIIHLREAAGEMLDLLQAHKSLYSHGLVLHCFSESREYAREVLNLGAYISFAGPLTFKKAEKTAEVARFVPADRYLIETDCPYLTPEPHRGETNEPAYVRFVAEKLSVLRGVPFAQIEQETTENAEAIFKKLNIDGRGKMVG